MSYDDDSGAPAWELISERWYTARKPHPCGCGTIQPGDRYLRTVGLLDGELVVNKECEWCHFGYPRPGSPEAAALDAECQQAAREDEEDYQRDQAYHREVVAHPDRYHPSLVDHARASLGREP